MEEQARMSWPVRRVKCFPMIASGSLMFARLLCLDSRRSDHEHLIRLTVYDSHVFYCLSDIANSWH